MKQALASALVLCLTVGLLAIMSSGVDAFEAAAPDASQTARCQKFSDSSLQTFCLKAYEVAGLNLPKEATPFAASSPTSRMALYKPDGMGPFPAVVLLHTCGAIVAEQTSYWIKSALANGYAAFVLDSWSQRGLSNGACDIAPGFSTTSVRVRDSYDALARLAQIPDIDIHRVAAIGFSHGARMAYLLANTGTAKMFSPNGSHFAAAVAVYGECFNRPTKFSYLRPPIDVPLLALLGARDDDGDVRECEPRLQAIKESGSPVEWHVFPDIGHAWDQPNFTTMILRPYPGSVSGSVIYKYDAKVTDESRDRAFAFLNDRLKK